MALKASFTVGSTPLEITFDGPIIKKFRKEGLPKDLFELSTYLSGNTNLGMIWGSEFYAGLANMSGTEEVIPVTWEKVPSMPPIKLRFCSDDES